MTTQPLLPGPSSPPARRLRRPGWRDTRLLMGVGLVATSVAVGATAFSAAARTVPVYVAADALVPGAAVRSDLLVVRQARLGESLDRYLRADEPLPPGLVVTRTVTAGELVPVSAVAEAADLELRPVAITPRGDLSGGVVEGATVDLWFVPTPQDRRAGTPSGGVGAGVDVGGGGDPGDASGEGAPSDPVELAAGLTVAEVSEPARTLAVGSAVTVHVLVPVDDLAAVLGALAADGTVEIVPVPGPRE